jgi:hypothetical protein
MIWHPSEIPFSAIHVMYPQNGSDAATSSKTHGDTPGQNCARAGLATTSSNEATASNCDLRKMTSRDQLKT